LALAAPSADAKTGECFSIKWIKYN
jgi:hypothetical protein